MIKRTRLVALLALLTIMPGLAMAQLDLKVTVNVEEAGTLFKTSLESACRSQHTDHTAFRM